MHLHDYYTEIAPGTLVLIHHPRPRTTQNLPLFQPGFNDKIAVRAGAKDAFYDYIADNPRRYLVKKICPEYFFHRLKLEINGTRCGLYGNLFLLDNPIKSAIKISRIPERTPDFVARKREWEETIRSGGVLVSPFINPYEREYMDAAIRNGSGIILVTDYRFSDRAKPYKELFDQCAEGKLLIVTTEQFASPPPKIDYLHAQSLNAIAAAIAGLAPPLRQHPPPPNLSHQNTQAKAWTPNHHNPSPETLQRDCALMTQPRCIRPSNRPGVLA